MTVRQIIVASVVLASMLFLSGCGTTRELAISHDRMVEVTMQAIQLEGHVKPAEIKRTDIEEKGGRLTMLKSPYIDYSKVEVQIDSREDHAKHPELLVKVLSNDTLYTRHKDLEARLMEVVLLELRAPPVRQGQALYVPPIYLAAVQSGLGDQEAALASLKQAVAERCEYLIYLPRDPMADALRRDPRFAPFFKIGRN